MRRDPHWLHFIVLLTLAAAMLACNLPGAQPSPTSPPKPTLPPSQPTQPPATQPATLQPPKLTLQPQPTQPPATLQPPKLTLQIQPVKTESALVTLQGGSGYIFSTRVITKDDRDIWWNADELVPDNGYRMISLGKISSLAQVKELVFPAKTPPVLVPSVGEGFGIEIKRSPKTTYALMRIVKLENQVITFEWLYPFTGTVK